MSATADNSPSVKVPSVEGNAKLHAVASESSFDESLGRTRPACEASPLLELAVCRWHVGESDKVSPPACETADEMVEIMNRHQLVRRVPARTVQQLLFGCAVMLMVSGAACAVVGSLGGPLLIAVASGVVLWGLTQFVKVWLDRATAAENRAGYTTLTHKHRQLDEVERKHGYVVREAGESFLSHDERKTREEAALAQGS